MVVVAGTDWIALVGFVMLDELVAMTTYSVKNSVRCAVPTHYR